MKITAAMILLLAAGAVNAGTVASGDDCVDANGQAGQPPCKEQSTGVHPDTQPLGLVRLQNSIYSGFEDIRGEVELLAGHWEGEPPQPGSASVPRVDFLGDLVARGDLDGDGRDEAAVVLTTNFGGTGVFHYLAVVGREGDENRNIATRFVGDRIQVRSLRIEEGYAILDLVRAGQNDPSCCPTEVASLAFRLVDGQLSVIPQGNATTLVPDVLSGQQWRLAAWKFGEPVSGRVTLGYADESFKGNAGCNQYSAPVRAEGNRGNITVANQIITTNMMCDPDSMALEQRFLELLPRVHHFWFHAGQLALDYGEGADFGVMFLQREE